MSTSTTKKSSRSFWPIAIAGYFTVVIISIAIFITWSIRQNMDLVRKDYYAEEIRFQQHLESLNRTKELSQTPDIVFDPSHNVVTVSITNAGPSVTGNIHFYRPSDGSLDKNIRLSLNADGSQQIDGRILQAGLWKIRLSWVAEGKEFFKEETIVIDRS